MKKQGWLILTRGKEEEIVIGDEIVVVRVMELRHDRVRLGIKAPSDIHVHRREIYEAIKSKEKGVRS